MVKMKLHPTLGIMVRSDGLILLPGYYFGRGKKAYKPEHWTYGSLVGKGYREICVNGTRYQVHRLVAETFLENSEIKPQVDHIDHNRSNNSVENLRWVTSAENNNNSVNNLPVGCRRKDMTKKEYDKLIRSRTYKKHKDYYKTTEYKLKKKLYYQKRKEAKCV